MPAPKKAAKPRVYEPRRVYVVFDSEGRYASGGTGLKALREDFPADEGYVIRAFYAEAAMRPGGRG